MSHNIFKLLAHAKYAKLKLIIIILDNMDTIIIHKETLDAERATMQLTYNKEILKTILGTQDATTMQEIEM